MNKRAFAIGVLGLMACVTVASAQDYYLFYAGGGLGDAADAIVEDGTLSTDNAVFSVLVADVDLSAGTPAISNWRAAGQLPINHPTSGTLLSWLYMESCVYIYNNYLYVGPGDWDMDGSRDTADFVAYAPINPDGSLGPFQLSAEFPGSPADQAICACALVDFGGGDAYYYVLGGTSGNTDRVLKAKIQSDGSLGAWSVDTSLPDAQWFNEATVSGTTIIHGNGHNISARRIHTANPSAADGSIAGWTDQGLYDSTVGGRWHYAMTTVESGGNRFAVIAGGNSSGGYLNDVKIAPLSGDVPGIWSTAAPVPIAFRAAPAVSVGNYVLIPGGSTTGMPQGSFDDLFIGAVDAAGNISWATTAMSRAQSFGGAAVLPAGPTPTPTNTPIVTGTNTWRDYR